MNQVLTYISTNNITELNELLWTPTYGRAKTGPPARTYIQQLCEDTEGTVKTCQGRWTIGKSGKRGSGISVLVARHDDDDDDCTNLCRSKISFRENWVPLKKHERKIKTRMGNSTRNVDKKNQRKQAKMMKQGKDDGIIRNRKEKAKQEKLTIQLEEISQKVMAKEGRLKRYRQRI